jgi:hypothetical protein
MNLLQTPGTRRIEYDLNPSALMNSREEPGMTLDV